MKVIIQNDYKVISNAHVEINDLSMSLFVNSEDRKWFTHQSSMWNSHDENNDGVSTLTLYFDEDPDQEEFHDDDEWHRDSVTLVPENDKEKELMDAIMFESQGKYQNWYLFPLGKVYGH